MQHAVHQGEVTWQFKIYLLANEGQHLQVVNEA
jgi:hypothetical protein